ncbi:MAG: hypothetical protein OXH96_14190 [Spirochaetaceae bacterium]|nr:hypothetical protein [Spirochaetaceae bacterium]
MKNATFEWDKHEKCIKIRARSVPDFNTPSKHNYTVTIPWRECKRIFGAFADAMVSVDEGKLDTVAPPVVGPIVAKTDSREA